MLDTEGERQVSKEKWNLPAEPPVEGASVQPEIEEVTSQPEAAGSATPVGDHNQREHTNYKNVSSDNTDTQEYFTQTDTTGVIF